MSESGLYFILLHKSKATTEERCLFKATKVGYHLLEKFVLK